MFFFFKQKTAYEMRISDWSSDVCSSDLARVEVLLHADEIRRQLGRGQLRAHPFAGGFALLLESVVGHQAHRLVAAPAVDVHALVEDRVGDRDRKSTRLNSSH